MALIQLENMKYSPIPSTSAIACTFSTPSLFSICTITRISRFAESKYSDAVTPHIAWVNGLPNPRLPTGGNRQSATTSLAFSTVDTFKKMFQVTQVVSPVVVLTIGTMTPPAPLSRASLICQLVLAEIPVEGILTIGVGPPFGTAPWIAVTASAAPGTRDISPCSQSISIHERWGLACATVRAAKLHGRQSQAPNAGFLAWKSLRSVWETIVDEVKTIVRR